MSKQADVISCGQDLNTSSGVLSVSLYSAHQTEGRDGRQEGRGRDDEELSLPAGGEEGEDGGRRTNLTPPRRCPKADLWLWHRSRHHEDWEAYDSASVIRDIITEAIFRAEQCAWLIRLRARSKLVAVRQSRLDTDAIVMAGRLGV